MRCLLVSALPPLPLHGGGQVRLWNIARRLARRHQVDLACFLRRGWEPPAMDRLREVFGRVTLVPKPGLAGAGALLGSPRRWPGFVAANAGTLAGALFGRRPLLSAANNSPALRRHLLAADRSGAYDLLYAETFPAVACLRGHLATLRTPLLLVEQNIESSAFGRQARQQRRRGLRRLMEWDVAKLRREEERFWRGAALLGALSPVDAEEMRRRVGREPLLVENGVDLEWFAQPVAARREDEVLFVGSFGYFQNVDALGWLLDEIWPRVAAARPQARLRIVGRGADSALRQRVAAGGLEIDDGVEDVREAFQRASALIAPIRAGSGTKYKVLEAMASGLPVVTTPAGAEGLPVQPGLDAEVESEASGLARALVRVLEEPGRARLLAEAALGLVAAYDWDGIVTRFEEQLEEALAGLRPRGAG
jgi:polysaccharide biosynthesis protein PslH